TWRFESFPAIAQIAPATKLVAGHFNQDEHLDLLLLQNEHSPLEIVGRFGGGLSQLLRGDGEGGFTPIPPGSSGIVI
ncbi:MAG: hypothetical protein ACKVI3_16315, partial [Verrucomicrobiia bacterium]